MVQTGAGVPDELRVARLRDARSAFLPNSLLVFVPLAVAHPARPAADRVTAGCSTRSATTRSRRACRACASWQVLLVLYVISALLAGDRRPPASSGLTNTASVDARRPVRAAVGRGRGHRRHVDHGRPRRLRGTIVGALILTVLDVAPVGARLPGGGPPDPVRRRSSSPSRRPTPGSPASPERVGERTTTRTATATSASTSGHEPQVGGRRARRRRRGGRSTAARCRRRAARGPGRGRRRGSPTVGRRGDRRAGPASHRSGSACPGLYDPVAGHDALPGQHARATGPGRPVAGPVGGGARAAGVPHQRRPGVRPRRAAAGRRRGAPTRWSA